MKFLIPLLALLLTSAQSPITRSMYNCGNPEGLKVSSGRIIAIGEQFEMIGDETVDEYGVSIVNVYDGTITGNDLIICEAQ